MKINIKGLFHVYVYVYGDVDVDVDVDVDDDIEFLMKMKCFCNSLNEERYMRNCTNNEWLKKEFSQSIDDVEVEINGNVIVEDEIEMKGCEFNLKNIDDVNEQLCMSLGNQFDGGGKKESDEEYDPQRSSQYSTNSSNFSSHLRRQKSARDGKGGTKRGCKRRGKRGKRGNQSGATTKKSQATRRDQHHTLLSNIGRLNTSIRFVIERVKLSDEFMFMFMFTFMFRFRFMFMLFD